MEKSSKALRDLGSGMGLVELGLDQVGADWTGDREHPHLAALHGDPAQLAPRVVLFLADGDAHRRVSLFWGPG